MLVSEKDISFIKSLQEELMSNFVLQEVDYITVKNTQVQDEYDDIYHENPKEEIVFNNPISLNAYVHTKIPDYIIAEYGGRYLRTIIVMIHKNYESDNGLDIEIGQFFKWNNTLYQIVTKTGEESQVWGNPNWQVFSQYVAVAK